MVEKRLDVKWSGFRMSFEYQTAQPFECMFDVAGACVCVPCLVGRRASEAFCAHLWSWEGWENKTTYLERNEFKINLFFTRCHHKWCHTEKGSYVPQQPLTYKQIPITLWQSLPQKKGKVYPSRNITWNCSLNSRYLNLFSNICFTTKTENFIL